MHANATRATLRAGRAAYGAWLSIPSSFSAEVVAHQGFDWVCIDMQHGVIDYQVAVHDAAGHQHHRGTPFVRVPWNEHGIIGKMLDAGANGIIIPMVNSVGRGAGGRRRVPLLPARRSQLRAGARHLYAGRDYFDARQRRDRVHPDDRDAARARPAR